MPRLTVVLMCVFLSLAALVAAWTPGSVQAASVWLVYDASLQEAPQDAALSLTMLPARIVVTITGDPVDGYYPVFAGGMSGWIRADAMELDTLPEASAPADAASAEPAPDVTGPEPPVAQDPAPDGQAPGETVAGTPDPAVAGDVIQDTVTQSPAVEDAASLDPSLAAPGAEPAAASDPVDAATPIPDAVVQDPAPVEPAPENPAAAEPVAADPSPVEPVADAAPIADLEPNAPPVAAPDAGPVGPASVTRKAEIFAGPGPDYGVLGAAAAGSLVEQTGHAVAGYVTVRYGGVTGWVALDLLGPAPAAGTG